MSEQEKRPGVREVLQAMIAWWESDGGSMDQLLADARAALATPDEAAIGRWKHKNRGTTYETIGTATAQSAEPLKEGEIAEVYRDQVGSLHVRRKSEFHDGRFERLPDARSAPDEAEASKNRPTT